MLSVIENANVKIKIITVLAVIFIAGSCSLTVQVPSNNIIIGFSEKEKREDISGSYGVITSTHHSDTLEIDYYQSIGTNLQLKDGSLSFEFNTREHSIFFCDLKK